MKTRSGEYGNDVLKMLERGSEVTAVGIH